MRMMSGRQIVDELLVLQMQLFDYRRQLMLSPFHAHPEENN